MVLAVGGDPARTGAPYIVVNMLADGPRRLGRVQGISITEATRSSIADRMATSEHAISPTLICSARESFAFKMVAIVRSRVRDMVQMRSAWQQKGRRWGR